MHINIPSQKAKPAYEDIEKRWVSSVPMDAPGSPNNPAMWKPHACSSKSFRGLPKCSQVQQQGVSAISEGASAFRNEVSHLEVLPVFSNTLPTFCAPSLHSAKREPHRKLPAHSGSFSDSYFQRNASKSCSHLGKSKPGRKIHSGLAPRGWEHFFSVKTLSVRYIFKGITVFSLGFWLLWAALCESTASGCYLSFLWCEGGRKGKEGWGGEKEEAHVGGNAPTELRGKITRTFLFQKARSLSWDFRTTTLKWASQ